MTISGKYELLRPLSAAGFRSFHARHVMTGQEVMVHFLGGGQRYEPRPVSDSASGLPADARAQVLDAGTYEGTQFLVTYPVEDFKTLSEWLDTVAPVRRSTVMTASTPSRGYPIPSPPPPPPPAPKRTELAAAFQDVSPRGPSTSAGHAKPDTSSGVTKQTGGFTARFGGGAPLPPDPREQIQVSRPPAPPPPAPSPSTAQGTGSFTAIFGGPGNPAPMPAPPQAFPPQSTRLPSSPASDSGSFSQMFGPSSPPAAPPSHGTGSSSSEFNKMFLPPDQSGLPPAPVELGRQRTPEPPARLEVGGFTDMFGGGVPSSAPTDPIMPPPRLPATAPPPLPPQPRMQPAAPQSAFDGATQIFSGPPLSARHAPAPAPVVPSGPSEFTLIHGGGGQGGGAPFAPPAPAAAAAPPPAAGSWMPELPGANVRPPVFHAPQLSAPQISGPGISAAGITPPTVRPPHLPAPSMSAPQLDVRMPPMQMPAMQSPPVVPAAVAPAGGSTFSPILAALLSCIGTVAVLAIVYVLVKG